MDHLKRNLRDQTLCIIYYSLKRLGVTAQNLFNQVPIREILIVYFVQWEMRPKSLRNVACESTELAFIDSLLVEWMSFDPDFQGGS